jgi:Carboxypeptidase regulatory-like domain
MYSNRRLVLCAALGLAVMRYGFGQQLCPNGIRVEGTVTDPTNALIPGAEVQAADGLRATTDPAGRFSLACVSSNSGTLVVRANGFSTTSVPVAKKPGTTLHLTIHMQLAKVETEVQVGADATGLDADRGAGTMNLNAEQVQQQLADDPDDLIQQLQIMASNSGGAPESTLFVIDGFQNASAMPPKNSIASVRINPDPYSPEYEGPTFQGGRVEITTKPGADKFHGALFFTDSDAIFNATDPFSVTATPASKQRYGFELSGPVVSKKIDFALALEKRDINEFNVVNAITLDSSGNQTPLHQTVTAPQRLWIGSARGDWQVTSKDVATLSFAANVNNLGNQGVGGLTLPSAGYSSLMDEYDLRLTNTQTFSANLLHETHIGYTWKRTQQTPTSTTPSLEVAGYFTGGGATSQNLNDRERDLEIDDDVMFTHGKHSFRTGVQSLGYFVHNYDPDTFNGAYVFGGGSAPVLDASNSPTGQTTTITPLQQYQRALQNLAGGAPTTYQATTGTPLVPLTQWRVALYGEDTIKLAPRFTMSAGLRYSFQTSPETFLNFAPRLAFSWAVDKKSTWIISLRSGIFDASAPVSYATEVDRLNGTRQQSILVYSPSYGTPLTPVAGSIQVATMNQFRHSVFEFPAAATQISIEHDLPHHWHPAVSFTYAEDWGIFRTRNINAPMVASSVGVPPDPTAALSAPRPMAPNLNIFQYENTGHLNGHVANFTLAQTSYKRFNFNLSTWWVDFKSDAPLQIAPPQSSYSNRGESSRPDWQSSGGSLDGTLHLPLKLDLSSQLAAREGRPYNITTGTDANGDGTFNDRPSYASAPGQGVYSTSFGLLTANAVNGNVPRNRGTMPSVWHLYGNVSRAFQLNPKDRNHPYTLTLNARASNLLNHTNTTAVGTVLSPTLGEPISAEAARRIELGARFAF